MYCWVMDALRRLRIAKLTTTRGITNSLLTSSGRSIGIWNTLWLGEFSSYVIKRPACSISRHTHADASTTSNYLGVGQIAWWKRLVLTQMCNRHALRANVNKGSKQAKRGECVPCERLVQGKTHMGKKALLARHFISLLRSQNYLIEIGKSEV